MDILLKFVYSVICMAYIVASQQTERALISGLLADYNPRARPVRDLRRVVVVQLGYSLLAVDQLIEKQQVLHTFGWLNMRWTDEFLVWDPADWGGLKVVVLPTKDIWMPDLVIRNSARTVHGDILDEDHVFRLMVNHNGTVDLWTAGDVRTSCEVDMTFFPIDDQKCIIQVDSWTYTHDLVKLRATQDKLDMDDYRRNGQWKVLDTQTIVQPAGTLSSKYDIVRFKIYLRRKPLYYVYNIVLPSIILSLLVLLIFLLPADAGEKISLGITVLLSFSVFQLIIADSMPKTSDYMPIISIYLICTMVITAVSLLCSVCVLRMHHQNPDTPVPSWLLTFARRVSRLICRTHRLSTTRANGHVPSVHDKLRIRSLKRLVNGTDRNKTTEINGVLETLEQLKTDLRCLVSSRKGDDLVEDIKRQWMEVADVIDRFLFGFFLFVIIITGTTLFGIYPTIANLDIVNNITHT